jgi:hypothetical protein
LSNQQKVTGSIPLGRNAGDITNEPPSNDNVRPDRRRRDWTGCITPLVWMLGTILCTIAGCFLGGAHYRHTHGEPNPGSYNEMRVYSEMIMNGGLIGAGLGAGGGAFLWLALSFLSKDARSH